MIYLRLVDPIGVVQNEGRIETKKIRAITISRFLIDLYFLNRSGATRAFSSMLSVCEKADSMSQIMPRSRP